MYLLILTASMQKYIIQVRAKNLIKCHVLMKKRILVPRDFIKVFFTIENFNS